MCDTGQAFAILGEARLEHANGALREARSMRSAAHCRGACKRL